MQREADVEEYERRPPWYMSPQAIKELEEEMRQHDEEFGRRLRQLRMLRFAQDPGAPNAATHATPGATPGARRA
eukprot:10551254-Heterocapsa_arctica.AAC.1